jgi:hypothetical protein
MADADSKTCSKCGQTLPVEQFQRATRQRDGRLPHCKACCKQYYHKIRKPHPPASITQCEHCGKDFQRPFPPRACVKHCSIECRFWAKVDKSAGADACWAWTGKARSQYGYGAFNVGGRMVGAHRLAWELTNGVIAGGMHVCHRCDNPLCCNPGHFFLGTAQDNMDDMSAKGRRAPMTPERRELIRQTKIGKPRPPEVRAKLRGKRSEEAKANIRAAQIARRERERLSKIRYL